MHLVIVVTLHAEDSEVDAIRDLFGGTVLIGDDDVDGQTSFAARLVGATAK